VGEFDRFTASMSGAFTVAGVRDREVARPPRDRDPQAGTVPGAQENNIYRCRYLHMYENSSWAQIKSLVARVDAQVARAAADVGSAADFARHLGIHPVVEPGLMWIAEQVPRGSFPPPYIVYSLFFHHTTPYNNKRE
jgi:hypothetical protein